MLIGDYLEPQKWFNSTRITRNEWKKNAKRGTIMVTNAVHLLKYKTYHRRRNSKIEHFLFAVMLRHFSTLHRSSVLNRIFRLHFQTLSFKIPFQRALVVFHCRFFFPSQHYFPFFNIYFLFFCTFLRFFFSLSIKDYGKPFKKK